MAISNWTFAIVKPDAVSNPVALRWISKALEANRLRVAKGRRMMLEQRLAEELYSVHREKFFYRRLIRHMCGGTIIAMRLESDTEHYVDALQLWRRILGPSKLFANVFTEEGGSIGKENDFKKLRLLFALSDTRNTGHGSDTLSELAREYALFEDLLHPISNANTELFRLLPSDCDDEEALIPERD